MGSRYLTDLADVCRSTGFPTIEVGSSPSTTGTAWKSRARSSGGFNSGLPNHVMAHHTASSTSADGWQDANYCTFHNENRPVCNILLSRNGELFVCAAGATNTNGSGHDPCGATADDSMNSSAIGIEASNNGTGEPWPQRQQDAYVALCRRLCDHYGIPVDRIHSHFEWAPDRKIDPAGPSRYATGANKWNMAQFRGDVRAHTGPTPPEDEVTDEDIERIAHAVWMKVLDRPEGGWPAAPAFIWLCDGRISAAAAEQNTEGLDDG